mgnify:CR=1 FL=1
MTREWLDIDAHSNATRVQIPHVELLAQTRPCAVGRELLNVLTVTVQAQGNGAGENSLASLEGTA